MINEDIQATSLYIILYISFAFFLFFAIKSKNNLLIFSILLAAISNVIGAPIIILNKDSYQYSGWNAVKSFDFSYIYFAKIYIIEYLNILLLVIFTILFTKKLNNSSFIKRIIPDAKISIELNQSTKSTRIWDISMFFIFILIILIVFFMYFNQIAIMGVEGDKLPFKLVGILFYTRGYILPITSFVIFNKSSKNIFILSGVIIISFIIGLLSASRGLAFFYMFPVLIHIITNMKTSFKYIIAFFLILFAYMITSISRSILFNDSQLNFLDLIKLVFSSESEFKSETSFFRGLINIIGTISNRLYGVQDLILTYQHKLVDPFQSFISFITASPVIEFPATDLYDLEWLPGQAFGVGLGLMGILMLFFKVNIFLYLLLCLYSAFLLSLLNLTLNRYFYNKYTQSYHPLYYFVIFLTAFNFVQGSVSFLYLIFISILLLIYLTLFNKKKSIAIN